jgi:hypothetical protein
MVFDKAAFASRNSGKRASTGAIAVVKSTGSVVTEAAASASSEALASAVRASAAASKRVARRLTSISCRMAPSFVAFTTSPVSETSVSSGPEASEKESITARKSARGRDACSCLADNSSSIMAICGGSSLDIGSRALSAASNPSRSSFVRCGVGGSPSPGLPVSASSSLDRYFATSTSWSSFGMPSSPALSCTLRSAL